MFHGGNQRLLVITAHVLCLLEAVQGFGEPAYHAVCLRHVVVDVVKGAARNWALSVELQKLVTMMESLDVVVAEQVHVAQILVAVPDEGGMSLLDLSGYLVVLGLLVGNLAVILQLRLVRVVAVGLVLL